MSDNFLPACPKGAKAYPYLVISSLDGTKVYAKAVGLVLPADLAGNKPIIPLAAAADPTWVTSAAADFDGSAEGTVALPAGTYRLAFKQADSAEVADWQNDGGIAYDDGRAFDGGEWEESTGGQPGTLVITPIQANAANPRYSSRILAPIAKGTAPVDVVTVTDGTGAAVDLTGRSLRMTFAARDCEAGTFAGIDQYTTGGGGLTVQGDDGNQVRIQHSVALTRTIGPGSYHWWLFDVTGGGDAKTLLLKGTVEVEDAVEAVS